MNSMCINFVGRRPIDRSIDLSIDRSRFDLEIIDRSLRVCCVWGFVLIYMCVCVHVSVCVLYVCIMYVCMYVCVCVWMGV